MARASITMLFGLVALAAAAAVTAAQQDCEPSKWGETDEIGSANLITADSVLEASSLIKTGQTYSLGVTIDSTTPAFPPRGLALQVVQPHQQQGRAAFPNMAYNDDLVQTWLGIGSQIDGLGHLGAPGGVYYNCNRAQDFAEITGLTKLGIDKIPPIVARGVVLDMAGHAGVEVMEAGQFFTTADVQAVEKKQGTPIREGDVVLFHTGWTEGMLATDPAAWVAGEPGIAEEVADYLASRNIVAAGADTWGLDVMPPENPERPFQGHVTLLKENGIYILEVMNTGPLVRDGAFEFLFVLGHAKIKGAVQMIINPVAIR